MRPVRTAVRGLAWVAAGAVVVTPLAAPGGPLSLVASAGPALTISGSIGGLEVGQSSALSLTVTNPGGTDAVVHALDARVTDVQGPCSASALRVRGWRGTLVVPAHGTAQAELPLELTEPCSNATWMLAYTSS